MKMEAFINGCCLRQRNPRTLSTYLKKLYVKYFVKRSVYIPSLPPFDPSRLKSLPKIKPFFFDPNSNDGPLPGSYFHLNSVYYHKGNTLMCGLYTNSVWSISKDNITLVAQLPLGTHNIQAFNSGLLYNHTVEEKIVIQDMNGKVNATFPIKRYPEEELLNSNLPKDHAAQSFGRGLITTPDGLIIGGSSPATISVYQIGCPEAIRTINLTMDVRNSIHGLALWRT
jgi:hypothetical protein